MTQADGQIAQIIAQADALLKKVRADLDASLDFFRDSGIDHQRLTEHVAPYYGPEQQAQVARLVKADIQAAREEARDAAARAGIGQGSTRPPKRPRNMV